MLHRIISSLTKPLPPPCLSQNGSAIRPWWIHHHYISAAVAVVMILWPITPTYRQFTPLFNVRALSCGPMAMLLLECAVALTACAML